MDMCPLFSYARKSPGLDSDLRTIVRDSMSYIYFTLWRSKKYFNQTLRY